jgi:hypothetical protein
MIWTVWYDLLSVYITNVLQHSSKHLSEQEHDFYTKPIMQSESPPNDRCSLNKLCGLNNISCTITIILQALIMLRVTQWVYAGAQSYVGPRSVTSRCWLQTFALIGISCARMSRPFNSICLYVVVTWLYLSL